MSDEMTTLAAPMVSDWTWTITLTPWHVMLGLLLMTALVATMGANSRQGPYLEGKTEGFLAPGDWALVVLWMFAWCVL